jgi:hypothetical protein
MAPRAHPHQPGRPGADLPPILTQAGPVSARLLSEDERITIGDGLIARHSIRAIAAQLGRSPSTISREIQNNGDPQTGDYQPFRAQQRSTARRARPKVGKLAEHVELREHVQRRLEQRWSPEQISRTLPVAFPDRPEMRVAPERSTRPSTSKAVVSCAANSPGRCAPAGPAAERAAAPSSAPPGSSSPW